MSLFVHVICDYAPGDLAWAEVIAAISARIPEDARIHITTVGSFETISTGFVLAQLGLAEASLRPKNLIVFANCAPRRDLRDPRANNEGEGVLYARLKNGVPVVVVNSGHSLSFVRDDIAELWSVSLQDEGSQFRSRDYFPKILAQVVAGDLSFRWHQLVASSVIPDVPPQSVGYIDSFGNLKTTIRVGDDAVASLSPGARVKVTIGCIVRTATVATGSFNVMEGDLAFAPGSSGHQRRFWEFFQRGGSAWSEFGRPAVGHRIVIEAH